MEWVSRFGHVLEHTPGRVRVFRWFAKFTTNAKVFTYVVQLLFGTFSPTLPTVRHGVALGSRSLTGPFALLSQMDTGWTLPRNPMAHLHAQIDRWTLFWGSMAFLSPFLLRLVFVAQDHPRFENIPIMVSWDARYLRLSLRLSFSVPSSMGSLRCPTLPLTTTFSPPFCIAPSAGGGRVVNAMLQLHKLPIE